jgi:putative ABC transport system substrate-binding protein
VTLGASIVALALMLGDTIVGQEDRASIVILASGDSMPFQETAEGFQDYLAQDRPAAAVTVYTLSDDTRTSVLGRITHEPPSVLVTLGTAATTFALTQVEGIPIVAAMLLDMGPVTRAPHATGVSLEFSVETSLMWLTRILPGYEAVGVLYDPTQNQQTVDTASAVGSRLELELVTERVATPRDLRAAMDQLARRTDVVWGIPDQTVLSPQTAQQILLFSFRHRIPFVGLSSEWVKAGALYALDRDYGDLGAQAGALVAKILGGTSPDALPPETPRTVVYDVNARTAEQLQITLSAEVLEGARTVVR